MSNILSAKESPESQPVQKISGRNESSNRPEPEVGLQLEKGGD
jgi:hypothetical protein